ncbi:magnesium transporter [Opitutaceae bacterium]|jgi:magnesium transporter|nr:magnesium transporter [Opitutaceae bacterium]
MSSNPSDSPVHDPHEEHEIFDASFEELSQFTPERLEEFSDVVLARVLSRLEIDQRREILRHVSEARASDILSEMDEEDAAEVLGAMRDHRAVAMIEEFDPDDAADVVAELEDEDRERLMDALEPETAEEINLLLSYDPETAGGVMTTDFGVVKIDQTIEEAIQAIRRQREEIDNIYYIYVVDDQEHLQGVISIREVLLARPGARIRDIMLEVEGVCAPDDDRELVAKRTAEFNLAALPVVDAGGKLIGIVTHDDVLDIVQDEATEDIQKMVGAGGDESILDSVFESLRKRNPWLVVNLVTISVAAAVITFYEDQIESMAILAVMMPVIANLGGNTGAQTLAVLIRSLAVGEIQPRDSFTICGREAIKGFLNGLVIGLITSVVVAVFTQATMVAVVVFVAMVCTMTFSGFAGAAIPLTLKKFNFDPAQSSSIFVTGIVDMVGFLIFLQLATWLLF